MRKCGIEIESLSAHRVVDKLAVAGIEVLGAEKTQKNAVTVWVNGKDRKKVFAILRGSCYNIKKVTYRGLERWKQRCMQSVGLLVGAVLFVCCVCVMQTRVLKIEIVGSGAYYEREVRDILSRNQTKLFSAAPKEGTVTPEILALPRVSFCSVALSGGVLTVTVEVSDEHTLIERVPLSAPANGTVEELVVIRGNALIGIGDEVCEGDVLVDCSAPVGESGSRSVIVIARVKVAFPVFKEYALSEKEALAQAYLDYEELTDVRTTQTENGFLVEGCAHASASMNLD